MPNHYHVVLVQRQGGSIPDLMTSLATSAARRFNLKYNQVGHLFQGPYKGNPIDSPGLLLRVARYIHLNPVVAGLVKRPEDWPWSDFAEAYLLPGLNVEEGELLLRTCNLNRAQYVSFVRG